MAKKGLELPHPCRDHDLPFLCLLRLIEGIDVNDGLPELLPTHRPGSHSSGILIVVPPIHFFANDREICPRLLKWIRLPGKPN